MPPQPIELLAVLSLQDALQAIAGDGYHYPVEPSAIKLDPNSAVEALDRPNGPRPFVFIEMRPEGRDYYPASDLKLTLPFTIHWVNTSDLTDDASRTTVFYRGCADVEKALAIDLSRGGVASDTRILNCRQDVSEDGKEVWAEIEGEVRIHRTYGLPNG